MCLDYTSYKARVTVLYVGSSKREKTDCVQATRQVKRVSRSFHLRAFLDFFLSNLYILKRKGTTVEHSSVTGTRRSYECFEGA